MKTYVLGAGASAHVGYPLTATLGADLLGWMKKQTKFDLYAPTAARLETTFNSTSNLEDLLTEMADAVSAGLADSDDETAIRQRFRQDYHVLGLALQERFAEIGKNPAGAYEQFCADVVQDGDCIITFNYDVSLERELRKAGKWDVGDGYGFAIGDHGEKSPVRVLKLHGSCNWLGSLWQSPGYGLGWRPVISDWDMSLLGYPSERDPDFRNARSGIVPALILPTPAKRFFLALGNQQELGAFFGDLWSQARYALRQSAHVVICGYSLPDADERARELLLEKSISKSAEISVVSGSTSEDIAERFRNHGYPHANAAGKVRFEDWARSDQFSAAPFPIARALH